MPIIDTHAHCVPPECLGLLEEQPEVANFIGDMSALPARLADMDRMGVDIQVLSAWQGFFNRSLPLARTFNDALAAYAEQRPDRLRAMAVVPFAEPDAAADELTRAVRELGLVGVEIGSNAGGAEVDDERFLPFWETAAALGVPVFIHPTNPLGKDRLKAFELVNLVGFVTDTALAAARLVLGGVLARYPGLQVQLAHGGGSMPFLRGRWAHGAEQRLGLAKDDVLALLGRFHVDSIVHSPDALALIVDWLGADKVLLGTDYPYDMGVSDPLKEIGDNDRLSENQKAAILGRNAQRLFKL